MRDDSPTLEDHTIVITGAGTGIGRAIALEAAQRGADLVLVGRRRELLVEVANECARLGARTLPISVDVSDADAPSRIVRAALSEFGRLDGLVNNAGVARFSPLEKASDEDVRQMVDVNVVGPLRLIREAIVALRASSGSVVNVTSIGGTVATPNRAAYGATKAAMNHLTRSLARELGPVIRVNAVLPGPIRTPMWEDLGLDSDGVDALREEMDRTTPAGRMGEPEDVAGWVCKLLEDSSAWVTGSLLTVDGGRSS